jgi:hypothetical protein
MCVHVICVWISFYYSFIDMNNNNVGVAFGTGVVWTWSVTSLTFQRKAVNSHAVPASKTETRI